MTGCPQCAELLQFVAALRAALDTFAAQQAAAERPRPDRQLCGHRYGRLGGGLTTCVVVGEHRVHDNGRGVMWAREAS